ncbi:MAG: D-aminoacyl-tRNA deacylase [Planctomycetota bacterium]
MKALVQRVSRAEVRVAGEVIARAGAGMLVLVGVERTDGEGEAERLAERVARYRFFPDEAGRMNRSILDAGGEALVVSQVTLAALGTGRRPSFDLAAPPERADALYRAFAAALAALGVPTRIGAFGARMEVELVNDGPVTFLLEEGGPGRRRR